MRSNVDRSRFRHDYHMFRRFVANAAVDAEANIYVEQLSEDWLRLLIEIHRNSLERKFGSTNVELRMRLKIYQFSCALGNASE
jgi:hypothetical protein